VCTLSWVATRDGYELLFNRDERHQRAEEHPAALRDREGVRYVAPLDGEAGGSWLATNEFGATVALLNYYLAAYEPSERLQRSRGDVVLELADVEGPAHTAMRLNDLELAAFRGFTLFVAGPGERPRCWDWDGAALMEERGIPQRLPLVSSGRDQKTARTVRKAAWRELLMAHDGIVDGALLERFHRGHDGGRGPWSACMHREDARTRSFLHVRVDSAGVEVRYEPDSPCQRAVPVVHVLPRRSPVVR